MTLSRSVLGLALLSFPLYEFHGAALHAATCQSTWTGAGTSDWNTAANWNPACIPGSAPATPDADTATFDGTGSVFTPNISATVTIEELTFNSSTSYTLTGSAGQVLEFSTPATSPNTININLGSHTINLPVDIVANTNINIASDTTLTLGTSSSAPGGSAVFVNVQGAGTLINESTGTGFSPRFITFSGVTVTNNGVISNDTSGAGVFPTIAGANVTNNSGATLLISSAAAQSELLISSGTITNDGAIGPSGHTLITISGGTVVNNPSGEITGNFQSILGTLVNNGVVVVGAAVSPSTTLTSAGIIQGTGSFQSGSGTAFTITNRGTVEPGDPVGGTIAPGTLHLNSGGAQGTYTQTNAGTLNINVLDATSFSALDCYNANLNGTLLVTALPGFSVTPGETLTILTATDATPGSLSGTFAQITTSGFTSPTPQVIYNTTVSPFTVLLSFALPPPSLTSYIGGLGETVFSSVNHTNLLLTQEMEKVRRRFRAQSSTRTAAVIREQSDELLADASDGIVAINRETRQKQEIAKRNLNKPLKNRLNVYAGPLATIGNQETKGNQTGFNYWSAGAITGFDYAFDQVGLGLLVNYERIEAHVKRHWGKFTIDEAHADLYATYAPSIFPELAFNGIIGGGYDWVFIRRQIDTDPGKEIAKSTPRMQEFDSLFGVEYTLGKSQLPYMGEFQVIPLASIQYIYLHMGHYNEHNADTLNLAFSAQRIKSLRSTLGARFNYHYRERNFSFFPEVNVAWQREYLDHNRSVSFTPIDVVGSTSSTIGTIGAGRNFALVGLDLLFTLYKRYGIETNYEFEWNNLFHDHLAYVGFNVKF